MLFCADLKKQVCQQLKNGCTLDGECSYLPCPSCIVMVMPPPYFLFLLSTHHHLTLPPKDSAYLYDLSQKRLHIVLQQVICHKLLTLVNCAAHIIVILQLNCGLKDCQNALFSSVSTLQRAAGNEGTNHEEKKCSFHSDTISGLIRC